MARHPSSLAPRGSKLEMTPLTDSGQASSITQRSNLFPATHMMGHIKDALSLRHSTFSSKGFSTNRTRFCLPFRVTR